MSHADLARRFYEDVMVGGDLGALDEILTADFVDHEEGPPGTPDGIEGVRFFVTTFREAFPDLQVSMDDVIESGDRVVVRATMHGTQTGDLMGVPASGNRVELEMIDIVRVQDGRVAEHWGTTDNLSLMQQIGAIPQEAAAS
ncbi:MAG: ester cyclase [Thermoleophilaceae bacterium]|nr:ester cyclase [Thermoleophilaceae bacterium]